MDELVGDVARCWGRVVFHRGAGCLDRGRLCRLVILWGTWENVRFSIGDKIVVASA
jgi:hypothetical protein